MMKNLHPKALLATVLALAVTCAVVAVAQETIENPFSDSTAYPATKEKDTKKKTTDKKTTAKGAATGAAVKSSNAPSVAPRVPVYGRLGVSDRLPTNRP